MNRLDSLMRRWRLLERNPDCLDFYSIIFITHKADHFAGKTVELIVIVLLLLSGPEFQLNNLKAGFH